MLTPNFVTRYLKTITLIIFVLALVGCWRDGPVITDEPIEQIANSLDAIIPSLADENKIVGLSVIVIRENKIRISKTFGYAELKSRKKVTEHTVYEAASLGKPIFAYIVATLATQNILDLDRPLYLYSGVEIVANDTYSREITARMVLSHTTGLPNLGTQVTPKFSFSPGSDFQYSGLGYQYLQGVIEKIAQKSLNELAVEIVFEPLSMTASSYRWQEDFGKVISSSYDHKKDKYKSTKQPQVDHAAWSLYTTSKDYAKFVAHIMRSSTKNGSTAAQLLTPTVDVAKDVQWGLGWGIQDTTPHKSFWHWGSKAGFKHYVVAYPVEQVAVIVMANSKNAFKITDEIMARSIGGKYPSYDWF